MTMRHMQPVVAVGKEQADIMLLSVAIMSVRTFDEERRGSLFTYLPCASKFRKG